MHICMLSREFREGGGGVFTHTRKISRKLIDLGNRVTVIATKNKGEPTLDVIDGIPVVRVHTTTVPSYFLGTDLYSRATRVFSYCLQAALKLRKIHVQKKFDVICGQGISGFAGALFKLMCSLPLVIRTAWPYIGIKNICLSERGNSIDRIKIEATHFPLIIMDKLACTSAEKVTALSKSLAYEISKGYNIPYERIEIIPNGINVKEYENVACDEIKEKYNLWDTINVLFVGRINQRKGVDYLIDAIPKVLHSVKNIRFLLVGSGNTTFYKRRARELGIEQYINFVGHVSHKDVNKYYASADIFILPSLYEGMPFVVLEAMAAGKPVISTNIAGIPDIINNGHTGFLIDPKDVNAIAKYIIMLTKNEKLRKNVGNNGKEHVKKFFNIENVSKRLLSVFEQTIMLHNKKKELI
ncbi:MAG: glycosyltransferase family 4 protein [Promethearchaeota archaeon]